MTTTDNSVETVTFEKGTWQAKMNESSTLLDRSAKARKRAGALLWDGAKEGITEWLPSADTDVSGEGLYSNVLAALGTARKGDASKIKTVALAARQHGLDLNVFENLSKAYAEATRLTKTVQQQADEDDAAEKAIEAIDAPKSTSSVDGAAALLLSKGIDGAVVAILDALGADNEAAHRAFMRAVSQEIAARVQAKKPKPAPKSTTPKTGATKATGTKTATTKAKPASAKAKPTPVSASKGDPNKKALPGKAKPKPAQNQTAVEESPVVEVEGDSVVETSEAPAKKAVRRAVPVRRSR